MEKLNGYSESEKEQIMVLMCQLLEGGIISGKIEDTPEAIKAAMPKTLADAKAAFIAKNFGFKKNTFEPGVDMHRYFHWVCPVCGLKKYLIVSKNAARPMCNRDGSIMRYKGVKSLPHDASEISE